MSTINRAIKAILDNYLTVSRISEFDTRRSIDLKIIIVRFHPLNFHGNVYIFLIIKNSLESKRERKKKEILLRNPLSISILSTILQTPYTLSSYIFKRGTGTLVLCHRRYRSAVLRHRSNRFRLNN